MINLVKRLVHRTNCLLGNYRNVLWLVGDGRSGTTWVADLINHDKKYREMFEPFHPHLVPDMGFLAPHQYIRPHALNERTKRVAADIFSGSFNHARVDTRMRSLLHHGLLIKDIFANLLCFALTREFPHIKPVLLIRNPFAVALSKSKTKDWLWLTEPLELLKQKELLEDYLLPFEDIIRKTSAKGNYLLNQILIWSILHYVPLLQFSPGDIHICFYEDIYTSPEREIVNIMRFAKGKQAAERVKLRKDYINRPSAVSGPKSTVVLGMSPLSSWKTELDPELIKDGFDILARFGLAGLYNSDGIPNREVLKKLQKNEAA